MKLVNKNKNVDLIIQKELLTQLGEYGLKHYPNEFGGFLIGNYSDNLDKLYITGSLLPKKYKEVPYLFERSIEGVINIFKKLFIEKKQYYVGEWHTHPNGSTIYSQTDLNTMIEIEKCDTVKIKNPILLIISINTNSKIDHVFYLYNDKKLTKYEKN